MLKNITLLAMITVMFLCGTVTAFAATVENPYIETTRGASVMGTSPVIFIDTSTGMPAYCLDYNRGIPDPESLSGEFDPNTIFDEDTYRGLEYLLLAGCPFETGGLSDTEAQSCTQLAVWCWTYETMGYGIDANRYQATNGRDDVYEYFTGLMEAARNQTPPDIGIDSIDIDMEINGEMLSGTTTIKLRNLTSYNLDESVLPEGVTVSGYTGVDGDTLTFTAPLNYAGETIDIENLFAGQDIRSALNLFWYDNSNPYQQRMVISYSDESTIAVTSGVTLRYDDLPEPEYGKIKLIKTAADTQLPQADAVFGVYLTETDEMVCVLISGEDGTAISPDLPLGDYYLKELSCPEDYILSYEIITVTITANETTEVSAVNQPIPEPEPTEGQIKLFKKDENSDEPLTGAVFGVYRISDDVNVCEMTTDSNGEAISPMLPVQDYYLKELKSPDGYEISSEKYEASVNPCETVAITVTNKKTQEPPESEEGRIKLIKKSKEDGALLSGAVFGVYRADTDVKVCELETISNGEAVSPLLPAGDYYIKELKAPDNYQISTDKHGITVKADETAEITLTNPKIPSSEPTPEPEEGKIKVIKKDQENGDMLSGAVFGIYRSSDDVKVCEIETNSRGEAKSPLLPVDDYYLKELKAPDNYQISGDKHDITVKSDEIVEITLTNSKIPTSEPTPDPEEGEIKVIKKDQENGDMLSGAVFGIYRSSDDVKICENETNSRGEAISTLLPVGDYYLKELKSPDGYDLSSEKYGLEVTNGKVSEITITNLKTSVPAPTPITSTPSTTITSSVPKSSEPTGTLLLLKKAEQTGKPLSGAEFGIYRVSDNTKVDTLKTDANGTSTITLAPGEYYLKELNAPYGYRLESTNIYFTVRKDTSVLVEVTNQRDETIPDADVPLESIEIPKTGEDFPLVNYVAGTVLIAIAIMCGTALLCRRKRA